MWQLLSLSISSLPEFSLFSTYLLTYVPESLQCSAPLSAFCPRIVWQFALDILLGLQVMIW